MFCILWPQKQVPLQSACVLAVAGQLKRSRIELGNQLLGPSLVRFVSEDTPPHFQITAFQETIFSRKITYSNPQWHHKFVHFWNHSRWSFNSLWIKLWCCGITGPAAYRWHGVLGQTLPGQQPLRQALLQQPSWPPLWGSWEPLQACPCHQKRAIWSWERGVQIKHTLNFPSFNTCCIVLHCGNLGSNFAKCARAMDSASLNC